MKERCTVESVQLQNSTKGSIPTLMHFQNGNLAGINSENTKCSRVVHRKTKNCLLVVAGAETYHGSKNSSEITDFADTYICVRNKRTNKIQILPYDQQTLKHSIYRELDDHIKPNVISKDYSRQKLLKEFGGRKAARFITNQEKMKLDVDAVKNELETTISEINIIEDISENLEAENHFDYIRPKFNGDAEHISGIYDINDVISADLIEQLEEEAKAVLASPIEQLPISSDFLLQKIREIKGSTSSNECLLRIKLIIYMDCLMNLIKSPVRSLKNLELSRITDKVENDVRKRFSDPNLKTFIRTTITTEKALCFFIVMALLINDNYDVDINVITRELNIARQKIIKFGLIVNARQKGTSDKLTLCLPKNVPSLTTKFIKRSRK